MTTAKEMIEQFNARHPDRAIGTAWKASKDALRARLDEIEQEALTLDAEREAEQQVEADRPEQAEPGAKEPRGTIGGMVAHLLMTSGAGYAEIARLVREHFTEARTTAKSVASTALALRKQGVPVATRRTKA
jgi:hypothetical protein